ncbi:predicted protein [Nematostella vectensis]|uniref:YqaJ viral recombinase domain-containing protein n=1 Tax=Nematostella vectensis TaxID=45351 RepID=A7SIK8_NEMVE|nr:predicted protein [Nematostella vectensis]|eukprot:XP_001628552.1 predicted protein [Nematostella vectensis]
MSSLGNQIILTEEDVPGAKLLKPAVDCSVIELKRCLECHGEKRTGKKRDLIQRVEGCLSIQKKVVLKVDGGKWYAMKASKLNLNTQGALQDESSQALCTDWKMFPSQDIPAMYNYGHLYHYLVESLQNEFLDLADEDKSDSEGSGTENADLSILRLLVRKFKENLQEQSDKLCGEHESSCQVPGTEDQSKSETWFAERWPRVTASKCHYLVSLWNAVLAFKVEAKQRCFKFLYERLWFKQNICTADMKYGIDAEPAARDAYVKATDNTVTETGLWINKMYPHLGASPDGLVVDKESGTAGILEIKCLKLLKTRTVEEVISGWKDCTIPKETLQRQCFKLESDGLIHLKRSHGYYFQIQLQLLVTGGHFCDFVLFSQKGPPSIERFYPESGIQMQIIKATSEFWEKVLVPEYFLMKVPRGLLPVILD